MLLNWNWIRYTMFVVFSQLLFWVDYPSKEINPDNMLLHKNGHMQLSDFCRCKPIHCSKLSTLNEDDSTTIDWLARSSSRTKWFSLQIFCLITCWPAIEIVLSVSGCFFNNICIYVLWITQWKKTTFLCESLLLTVNFTIVCTYGIVETYFTIDLYTYLS
jgi:hypothetical protein